MCAWVMHLCSTLLTYLPAFSPHESGPVNVEVLKNFHGLTNPKMLPPALHSQTGNVRELYIREHYVIREIRENFQVYSI